MKVENNIDDPPSSARSRKAPSVASSRRGLKIRKIGGGKTDSDTKSFVNSFAEKKENQNNLNSVLNKTEDASIVEAKNLNYYPLDVPPPRVIPDDERYMREKKEKQTKLREVVR